MNRLLIGLGLLLLGLTIYYMTYRTRHEEVPQVLTYAIGLSACIFITILVYNLMQYFKKK